MSGANVSGSGSAAYESLKKRFAEICQVKNAAAVLSKDAETGMAAGSAADRTQQLITLSAVAHRMINEQDIKNWLDEAEKNKSSLPAQDQRNLELMRKNVEEASVPEHMAEEFARIESEGEKKHGALRPVSDWQNMEAWFRHTFDTAREFGRYKMARQGFSSIYEALLDSFSPGLKAADVAAELDKMEKALPALIKDAVQKQSAEPAPLPLTGPFPKEQQEELCRRISKAMGFDFNRGNLYVIDGHPSSGGTSDDTRFTTDCEEDNFLEAVYSTIHETGHAMYDQNQPQAWRYQPAGSHLGMAIHESQSRIMEVQACLTPEFFEFLSREAQDVFGRQGDPELSADNLRKLRQQTEPSFIRIYADELTYPAHIILRHKLEKAIIEEKLDVKDLPQAWNDGMKSLLGVTPPDASKGHMQDIHWPCGYVGYFPAYTLGDMGAAQLFRKACADKPDLRSKLANGNFKPLKEWLADNVHGKGALVTAEELFVQATGEKLNADYYLDHLSQRYCGKPYQPAAAVSGTSPAPQSGPNP